LGNALSAFHAGIFSRRCMMSDTEIKKEPPQFNHVYRQDNGLYQIRLHEQSIQVCKDKDGKCCLIFNDGDHSFAMHLTAADAAHLSGLLL